MEVKKIIKATAKQKLIQRERQPQLSILDTPRIHYAVISNCEMTGLMWLLNLQKVNHHSILLRIFQGCVNFGLSISIVMLFSLPFPSCTAESKEVSKPVRTSHRASQGYSLCEMWRKTRKSWANSLFTRLDILYHAYIRRYTGWDLGLKHCSTQIWANETELMLAWMVTHSFCLFAKTNTFQLR